MNILKLRIISIIMMALMCAGYAADVHAPSSLVGLPHEVHGQLLIIAPVHHMMPPVLGAVLAEAEVGLVGFNQCLGEPHSFPSLLSASAIICAASLLW